MSDTELHQVHVKDPALGVFHLMATKGMIHLVEDKSLDEHTGRIHISSDPNDKNATLHINRGDNAALDAVYPPRVTSGN